MNRQHDRWAELTGGQAGEEYAQRFARLAESGHDIHGEASFCAALLKPPARILDAGCGTGRFASMLEAGGGAVIALDHDPGMLAVVSSRLAGPCLLGDVAHLPLRSRSVDVTVAVTVLEFVPDPAAALAEPARVTRPGGRVVVAALNPNSPWGLAHPPQLRSGTWCSARFLTRRRLRALGSTHGRARLWGVLYAPTAFPGLRWAGPALEVLGRLAPAIGAFQVLVIERSSP